MTVRRTTLVAVASVAVGITLFAAPLTASAATTADRGNGNSSHESGDSNQGESHDHEQSDRQAGFSIGLWGDQPYSDAGLAALPKVIASINAQPLAFTIFDGDIKSGSSPCVDAQYDQAASTFAQISWPSVYTPGDNEWTDCDRKKAGYWDPNERLAKIRTMFFATERSLGATTIELERQNAQFPENARWSKGGVTFITINTPGTDNNYPQVDGSGAPIDADGAKTADSGKPQNGDLAEYTARNAANLAWLEAGFRDAQRRGSKGIMIVQQADMWATNGDVITHYADEKAKLAQLVASTKRPVVLVNGDSHGYLLDNPLLDGNGAQLPNFQRLITDGETAFGWTKVDINANNKQVFTFTRQVVAP